MSGAQNCGCDPDMIPAHVCDRHLIDQLTDMNLSLLREKNALFERIEALLDSALDATILQETA